MSTEPSQITPPALPPAVASAPPRPPKNPLVAAAFSFFFPGLGQVYNGRPGRALVFFAAFVSAIYLTAEVDPLPFAFFIPFAFLYNVIDAYRGAVLANARAAGGAVDEEPELESPVWGGALIAIGLVLLMNNLGWLNLADLKRYWPLLLIAAGLGLIYGSFRKRRAAEAGDAGKV